LLHNALTRQKEYSWDRSAKLLWDCIEKVLSGGG
jgi:hypothetical protein